MKTRFILIASLAVLVLLINATVPADAQRRSYNKEVVKEQKEQKNNTREATERNARKVEETREKGGTTARGDRQPASTVKKEKSGNRNYTPAENRRTEAPQRPKSEYRNNPPQKKSAPGAVQRRNPETNRSNVRNSPERHQRESFRKGGPVRNGTVYGEAVSPRERREHYRTIYRLDGKDSRYTPSKNFKGNKNHWKADYSRYHVHYKNHNDDYYRKYDHRKYLHWDHQWENYHWTVNSWRDYYYGYHPYSYRFHRHYYFHPHFGHVIRKFGYKPDFFVHNHIRYYNFNGHFFRHFPGVGYVLTDMPFGLVFHKLPHHTERVYINGFLYFRSGNLFFEKNPNGYALIHYPERYFALDADYYNGGYYQEVDF